jgi:hypothetical protein
MRLTKWNERWEEDEQIFNLTFVTSASYKSYSTIIIFDEYDLNQWARSARRNWMNNEVFDATDNYILCPRGLPCEDNSRRIGNWTFELDYADALSMKAMNVTETSESDGRPTRLQMLTADFYEDPTQMLRTDVIANQEQKRQVTGKITGTSDDPLAGSTVVDLTGGAGLYQDLRLFDVGPYKNNTVHITGNSTQSDQMWRQGIKINNDILYKSVQYFKDRFRVTLEEETGYY